MERIARGGWEPEPPFGGCCKKASVDGMRMGGVKWADRGFCTECYCFQGYEVLWFTNYIPVSKQRVICFTHKMLFKQQKMDEANQ